MCEEVCDNKKIMFDRYIKQLSFIKLGLFKLEYHEADIKRRVREWVRELLFTTVMVEIC